MQTIIQKTSLNLSIGSVQIDAPSLAGSDQVTIRVSRDPNDYAPVRQRIERGMSNRFQGWDNEFDRQFDSYSYFFLLVNQHEELLAGLRLILSEDASTRLPIQLLERNHKVRDHYAGEFSGFWYQRSKYGLLLGACAGLWVDQFLAPLDVYAVYESKSRVMRGVYLDMMQLEQIEPYSEISYPGFIYRKSHECVKWTVALDRACSRRHRSESLLSNVAPEMNIDIAGGAQ